MPNHIIAYDEYSPATTPALMRAARSWPGVVGTQVRVPWRDLERRAGEYTFEIFDDLSTEELKSLTLMIVDRVYNHANKPSVQQPLPDYMAPLALPTIDNGWAARRWSLYFQSRFNALAEALARDRRMKYLGAIAIQEPALGLKDWLDYMPLEYIDILCQQIINTARRFPTVWYTNFIQHGANANPGNPRGADVEYIVDVINVIAGYPVTLNCPDIIPNPDTTPWPQDAKGALVKPAADVLDQLRKQHHNLSEFYALMKACSYLGTAGSAQHDTVKNYTPQHVADFARDHGMQTIYWTHRDPSWKSTTSPAVLEAWLNEQPMKAAFAGVGNG